MLTKNKKKKNRALKNPVYLERKKNEREQSITAVIGSEVALEHTQA